MIALAVTRIHAFRHYLYREGAVAVGREGRKHEIGEKKWKDNKRKRKESNTKKKEK